MHSYHRLATGSPIGVCHPLNTHCAVTRKSTQQTGRFSGNLLLLTTRRQKRSTLHSSRTPLAVKCTAEEPCLEATDDKVIIVGAGIAGLSTAAALHKVGIPAVVLERAPEERLGGSSIGLWKNAWRALDALGVAEPLREAHPLLDRVELCASGGKLLRTFLFDECEGGPHEFRGVRRSTLLAALASAVPPSALHYSCPIAEVSQASGSDEGAVVRLASGRELRCRAVVGADGARSVVARQLQLAEPNYAGYGAYRGLARFEDGMLPVPAGITRMVFGAGVRAGMYAISNTEVYWFTTFNSSEDAALAVRDGQSRQQQAAVPVAGWGWGILDCIQNTPDASITCNRIVDRWLLPGRPVGKGLLTVLGDAAHPMTPNLGQGGCAALEDAVVLARTLKAAWSSTSQSLESALRDFEKQRSGRVAYLTVRANLMGAALQMPYAPVVQTRNYVVSNLYSPAHFLDHTAFDCGTL